MKGPLSLELGGEGWGGQFGCRGEVQECKSYPIPVTIPIHVESCEDLRCQMAIGMNLNLEEKDGRRPHSCDFESAIAVFVRP